MIDARRFRRSLPLMVLLGGAALVLGCDQRQQPLDPTSGSTDAEPATQGSPMNPGPTTSEVPDLRQVPGSLSLPSGEVEVLDGELPLGPPEGYNRPERPQPARSSQSSGGDVVLNPDGTLGFHNSAEDGRNDLVWRNPGNGSTNLWQMDKGSKVSDSRLPNAAAPWRVVDAGVFESGTGSDAFDQRDDILWRNPSNGTTIAWVMHGKTYTGTTLRFPNVSDTWRAAATGDFEKNWVQRDDIVWRNTSNGRVVVWLNDGSARIDSETIGTVNLAWEIAAVADFSGGAQDDILWRNQSTGGAVIWEMRGTTKVDEHPLPSVSSPWEAQATGNFDADDNTETANDIVWRNPSNGTNVVWMMDGSTRTGQQTIEKVAGGSDWAIVGAGEFSKQEIAFTRTATPQQSIPDNGSESFTTRIVTDAPVIDLDVGLTFDPMHTFVGDLNIQLTQQSTSAEAVLLDNPNNNNGDCNGNGVVITADDEAAGSLATDCLDEADGGDDFAYQVARNQPVEPLSVFDGDGANGNWTLDVSDEIGGDTGTLDFWSLNFVVLD